MKTYACTVCGKEFSSKSYRAKYCAECAKSIRQKQSREAARRSHAKRDNNEVLLERLNTRHALTKIYQIDSHEVTEEMIDDLLEWKTKRRTFD